MRRCGFPTVGYAIYLSRVMPPKIIFVVEPSSSTWKIALWPCMSHCCSPVSCRCHFDSWCSRRYICLGRKSNSWGKTCVLMNFFKRFCLLRYCVVNDAAIVLQSSLWHVFQWHFWQAFEQYLTALHPLHLLNDVPTFKQNIQRSAIRVVVTLFADIGRCRRRLASWMSQRLIRFCTNLTNIMDCSTRYAENYFTRNVSSRLAKKIGSKMSQNGP